MGKGDRRLVAAVLVVLAGLAGCSSGGSRHACTSPPRSASLPRLPAQGLIDEERRGVALLDLRGCRLAWLPGFSVYPRNPLAQLSAADAFLSTELRPPLLHGPRGSYRLDAARHALVPVRGASLALGGGATVVGRSPPATMPTFSVRRAGRTLLRGSEPTFRILSRRLVQADRTLLDLRTGRRWSLPAGCLPAGVPSETRVLACGVAHGAEAAAPLVLERLEPDGSTRRLTSPLAELIPDAPSLSPDGRWVAVEGDTGCAASYVYVAPAAGGAARLVYGRSPTEPFASNYSSLLGWSADGRLVVLFEPPHCDTTPPGPPPRGVYLVDPRTLTRTFVTASAVAMWGSAARG